MPAQDMCLILSGPDREECMNIRVRLLNKYIAGVFVAGSVLLSGCVITADPDRVPMQKTGFMQDLSGVSLVVMSAGRDASPGPILTEKGVDVGFVGDRQIWSRKLSDALAGELARKGAALRVSAPFKLSVAVTEVTLVQTGEINQFKVKVSATSSKGWAKDYEASAEAKTGVFETVDSMTRRLAGQSLAEINKAILADREFLTQLGKAERTPKAKSIASRTP